MTTTDRRIIGYFLGLVREGIDAGATSEWMHGATNWLEWAIDGHKSRPPRNA